LVGTADFLIRLPATLPQQVESVLARSVRELLTNVVKHAEASGVTVRIRRRADFLELSVEDEGIGPQRGAADGTELNGGFGQYPGGDAGARRYIRHRSAPWRRNESDSERSARPRLNGSTPVSSFSFYISGIALTGARRLF
jgi:hypothetical protein